MAGNDNLIALSPHPLVVDETPVMYRAGQIRSLFSALADRDAQIERMRSELDRLATPAPPPDPRKDKVAIKPLEWMDESADGYVLFTASSAVGFFTYGVDRNGVAYHQAAGRGADHADAMTAKDAAEADHRRLVLLKAEEIGILATPPTAPVAARSAAEEMRERCAAAAVDHTPYKHEGTLAAHITGKTIERAIRALALPGEEA